jgi:hypothetical protein
LRHCLATAQLNPLQATYRLAPWSPAQRVDTVLLKAILRAHRWRTMLEGGEYSSAAELAKAEKVNDSDLSRILRLIRNNWISRTVLSVWSPEVQRGKGLSEKNRTTLPVGRPELKLELATDTWLYCQLDRSEKTLHRVRAGHTLSGPRHR